MDPKFLAILACPLCANRPPLEMRAPYLVCTECGRGYPIRDGIPCLLPEDAMPPEQLKDPQDGK